MTTDGGLRVAAVYACVNVLARTIGTLPLIVYSRGADGRKERATRHPLYAILHDQPNPEMTSTAWREALMGHVALWGNAYCRIERDRLAGRVVSLWPMRPDHVIIDRSPNGSLVYRHRPPNKPEAVYFSDEVLHVRGLTSDGITGYSVLQQAREAAPLAAAAEEYAARFFGGNGRPGGLLKHPGTIGADAAARLKADWEAMHSGLGNAHRIAVLEEGMEWQTVGMPNSDLQFIEIRKFQVVEIARLFGVPPHKIGDLERSTYSNIEHQGLEFVQDTIRPWAVRWEQELASKLLLPAEREEFYPEFLLDGLLRGDLPSRYQAYATGRSWGWLSANDVRDLENMNRIENGDIYLFPLNMTTPEIALAGGPNNGGQNGGSPPAPPSARELRAALPSAGSADNRDAIARRMRPVFADAAARMIKREADAVRAAAERWLGRRDTGEFSLFLDTFYGNWPDTVERIFAPAAQSLAESVSADAAVEAGIEPDWQPDDQTFTAAYVRQMAESQAGRSRDQLKRLLLAVAIEAALDAVNERLTQWTETRADRIAERETIKLANGMTIDKWRRSGVTKVRWVTRGSNCAYCSALGGKVIGVEDSFLGPNDDFQPEGAASPLRPRTRIRHAPAHAGCNCGIAIGG